MHLIARALRDFLQKYSIPQFCWQWAFGLPEVVETLL